MIGIALSYRSPSCEIRPSRIHGQGLFATRAISSGEVVAIRGGHIVSKEHALAIDASLGGYSHPITDDFFLAPLTAAEVSDVAAFFNHGCEPNIMPVGQIVFAAAQQIRPGDEILCDYGTIVCYSEYRLECNCHASGCRRVVTGDDWRRPVLRERYRGRFSTQIEEKIRAEATNGEGR